MTEQGRQPRDGWVELTIVPDHIEADILRAFLESEGVPVMLMAAMTESAYVVRVGPLSEVRVLVPPDKYDLAHALLEARADDEALSE